MCRPFVHFLFLSSFLLLESNGRRYLIKTKNKIHGTSKTRINDSLEGNLKRLPQGNTSLAKRNEEWGQNDSGEDYAAFEHDDNCPENNRNYGGRGLERKRNVKSWEACSDLCSKRSDCNYWTWHHGKAGQYSYICKTMTTIQYNVVDKNCVSGTRACGRASQGQIRARSSSEFGPHNGYNGAHNAIDGHISKTWWSLFASSFEDYPWLEISTPEGIINGVEIVTRFDCCWTRLQNIEIRAGLVPVPHMFKGKLTVNRKVATFVGPASRGQTYQVNFDRSVLAKYVTLQNIGKHVTLEINEITILKAECGTKKRPCQACNRQECYSGGLCYWRIKTMECTGLSNSGAVPPIEGQDQWSEGRCSKFLDNAKAFLLTGDFYGGGMIFTLHGKAFKIIGNEDLRIKLEFVHFKLEHDGIILRSGGKTYKEHKLKTTSYDENLPTPGLYIADYTNTIDGKKITIQSLIEVTQESKIVEGIKITGDPYVPARKKTLYINTSTKETRMMHASLGFKNAYWIKDYSLEFLNKTTIAVKHKSYNHFGKIFQYVSDLTCFMSNLF